MSSVKRLKPLLPPHKEKEPLRASDRETITHKRITRAAQRLRDLKATGAELQEILGSEAGAVFIRDDCNGNDDLAYATIALVYNSFAYEHWIKEKDKDDRSKRPPPLNSPSCLACFREDFLSTAR